MGVNKKVLEGLEIKSAGSKGKGVAHNTQGKTVLVSGAVPGDVVDVQITKKRSKFLEAKVLNIVSASEARVVPKCPHFGVCGGCKWQNLKYEEQLFWKQKEVEENLKRLGGLSGFEVMPIAACEEIYYYRNKMEFSFSSDRWITAEEIQSSEEITDKNALGFHIPGMWSKVLDLKECHLQADPSNEIRNELRRFAAAEGLAFFDLRNQEGLLRTLMLRNTSLGEWMLLLQFYENDQAAIEKVMAYLQERFPQITSFLYAVNPKGNDSIYDLDIRNYSGKEYIREKLGDFEFRIGPKSFFQTNSKQAERLYEIVADFADLKGEERIYDLYCGTGTIGIFLSKLCKQIVGVESVNEAVEAARINAEDNKVGNAQFVCGDMKEVLTDAFFQVHGKPDLIVTDPPRDGMHKNVVEAINRSGVERVVYVSCNSATQARDLALMKEHYELIKICPVDLFPQTHHVENVALLQKRK